MSKIHWVEVEFTGKTIVPIRGNKKDVKTRIENAFMSGEIGHNVSLKRLKKHKILRSEKEII